MKWSTCRVLLVSASGELDLALRSYLEGAHGVRFEVRTVPEYCPRLRDYDALVLDTVGAVHVVTEAHTKFFNWPADVADVVTFLVAVATDRHPF